VKRAVLSLFVLAACGPEPKAPTPPAAARLFYSNVELAPGRRFPSPLARGRVNGRETVFIIDTGAQVSVVDAALARDAGLEITGAGQARDPSGGAVAMTKAPAPHLVVDGLGPLPERLTAVIALPEILTRLGVECDVRRRRQRDRSQARAAHRR